MIINIDGIDIHYEVYGDVQKNKKPLLLLHGWMASIPAMAPIWQYFKHSRQVIVLDFPGQGGQSGMLKEEWGVPEYAEMVKTFMERLDIVKPDVIAHSFGGRVAIYLASNDSDLFHKIVLTDAAGIKPKMTFKKWFRIKSYRIGRWFLKMTSSSKNYEKKLEKLRAKFGSSDYSNLKSDIMRKTFNKVIQLDLRPNLKKIQNPCLLMWGENDQDTPLYMAKIMEKEIKDSGLVVLKNAGHFSYIDNAGEYNLVVENFLGG